MKRSSMDRKVLEVIQEEQIKRDNDRLITLKLKKFQLRVYSRKKLEDNFEQNY